MSDEKQQTEVARFYTRSRKFPRLIGRLHDGTKIPGGPYTVTQAIVAAVVLALGLVTRGLWGTGTILVDIPIVDGAPAEEVGPPLLDLRFDARVEGCMHHPPTPRPPAAPRREAGWHATRCAARPRRPPTAGAAR